MGKKLVEKKIFFSILAGIMIGSATVVSANQAIEAIQNHKIKVRLNGSIQTFKDEKTGEVTKRWEGSYYLYYVHFVNFFMLP